MVCQLPVGNDTTSTAVYKDETTSSSEDEDDFETVVDGTLSESVKNVSLPNGIIVNDSSYVHIGNKTYNGNVTIKQFVYPASNNEHANDVDLSDEQWFPSDSDVKVYNKSDDKDYNHENKQNTYAETGNPDVLSGLPTRWCLVLVGLVILLATVALIVSSMFAIETIRLNSDGANGGGKRTPIIPANDSGILYNGLRVVPRNEWLAQPPLGDLDPLVTPVPRVIITHTASEPCDTTPKCIILVRSIQMFHIEGRSWYDIGYNFLVGGDGVAYIGRGWDAVGAHTKLFNNVSIGIAFIGTFVKNKPPDVQIAAARKLIETGIAYNKISKTFILNAHCQLLATASPGFYLYEDMKTWGHLETGKTNFSCENNFANFTDDSQKS